MDKQVVRHLKKQFRKGKSSIANIADAVLLWLFSFFLVCGAVWSTKVTLLESAILGGTAATALLLLTIGMRRHRFGCYLERVKNQTSKKLMLERLMLLSSAKLNAIGSSVFEGSLGKCDSVQVRGGVLRADGTFCYVFFNHPDVPVDMRQLFGAARLARDAEAKKLCTLTASEYTEDAVAFAGRINATLLGQDELCKHVVEERPTESDILNALSEEAKLAHSTSQLKKQFLDKGKTRSYILCALLTMAWPFIFGFNIIYPLMAVFAWGLAFFSMRAPKTTS